MRALKTMRESQGYVKIVEAVKYAAELHGRGASP
jgi:hypothetical protein